MLNQNFTRVCAGYTGIALVTLFITSFAMVAAYTPGFDVIHDYISKLGATGQPFAIWWNLTGFVLVGLLFSVFGWAFGHTINNKMAGTCIVVAGCFFALGAIPADFSQANSTLSKAHFVSICFALAGWCFALSSIGRVSTISKSMRIGANAAGVLAIVPMAGIVTNQLSAPVAHRLVLMVVFGWILFAAWYTLHTPVAQQSPAPARTPNPDNN